MRKHEKRTSCCSTRLTTGSTYGLPSSVRNAPTPRLILFGASSARKAELRPRMGSAGASGTSAKTLVALAGATAVVAMVNRERAGEERGAEGGQQQLRPVSCRGTEAGRVVCRWRKAREWVRRLHSGGGGDEVGRSSAQRGSTWD